ncbi:hypothetical protein ACHAXT_012173 [Thalassiosira profunda]
MTMLLILLLALTAATSSAFSAGKGFGRPPSSSSSAFAPFDRFRASCPADIASIQRYDPSLLRGDGGANDVWVAVYRSSNNLPSVCVRTSTTAPGGDSETLVSSSSSTEMAITTSVVSNESKSNGNEGAKPVAVARLGKDAASGCHIIDSMRCTLKKENTDPDCDGGSEHAEAIGVCIDELVHSYLQRYLEDEDDGMAFDGGIHFRGTLVSGKLLDSRGFREVSELSADMHSHESDLEGALSKYAERSTSREVAKNPGARDRALKIVSGLGRIDREEDARRAKRIRSGGEGKEEDGEEGEFDPWASVKRYL